MKFSHIRTGRTRPATLADAEISVTVRLILIRKLHQTISSQKTRLVMTGAVGDITNNWDLCVIDR